MKIEVRNALQKKCDKLINAYHYSVNTADHEAKRKQKRSGKPTEMKVKKPFYWSIDPKFNPFKMRIKKKLDLLSHTLSIKIMEKTYRPEPAIQVFIPKENYAKRELAIFQVPDSAISKLTCDQLMRQNITKLSRHAYAYRPDIGALNAIDSIFSSWKTKDSVYTAEYDFKNYFDSISHDYILKILANAKFECSPEQMHIIKAFLESEYASPENYAKKITEKRRKGVPQGLALSSFLANIACWELDKELEEMEIKFCRYADDILVWDEDIEKVKRASEVIKQHANRMSVEINYQKSEGIKKIAKLPTFDPQTKTSVDYLGHRIYLEKISLKDRNIQKIKDRIGSIISENLLQLPLHGVFHSKRLEGLDWDYVSTLYQIRNYLTGSHNIEQLYRSSKELKSQSEFKGVMNFFKLVNDYDLLSNLDGWLIYSLNQALRKRQKLWAVQTGRSLPGPSTDWIEKITDLSILLSPNGKIYDLRVPSFHLINKVQQKVTDKTNNHRFSSKMEEYAYPS